MFNYILKNMQVRLFLYTAKPVLGAISIKRATCIKQVCIQYPQKANTFKITRINKYI